MQFTTGEALSRPILPVVPEGAPDPRRMLVAPAAGLDAVLAATPLLTALRRRFPRTRLVALAPAPEHSLLEGNPDLDRVIAGGAGTAGRPDQLWGLVRALRAERIEWAILL